MDYSLILISNPENDIPLTREIVQDDKEFAQAVLESMKRWLIELPTVRPAVKNVQTVRANLSEFSIWELGEKRWHLYTRRFFWPANKDPWRISSNPGIDILATDDDKTVLLVIEVKSSDDDGSNLVTNAKDGLKGDFQRLFEGDVRTRLVTRVMDVVHDFQQQGHPRLAQKIRDLVGSCPTNSPRVSLIGVLVCVRQGESAENRRKRAFERLHNWLAKDENGQQWKPSQCHYYTVEINNLDEWLNHLLPKFTEASNE